MTWNESAHPTGPAIGWHWYRETPASEPRRVKVFDVVGLKYAWPMGDDHDHPLTVRVEQCTGEFVGQVKSQDEPNEPQWTAEEMAWVESRPVDRTIVDAIVDEYGTLDRLARAALKASGRGAARHGG